MDADQAISILQHAIGTGTLAMAPILAVGLTIGVMVGVLQSATQVNEPTLTFVPKVIGVGAVGAALLPWLLGQLVSIVHYVIEQIAFVRAL